MFEFPPHTPRRSAEAVAQLGRPALMEELTQTFEELNVAEEELRVQNDELARAHEIIASDAQRYRQLFEQAPVAYVVTDLNGTISDANRAADRLFGYRRIGLRGKPIVVFTRGKSRRKMRAAMTSVGAARDTVTVTLNMRSHGARVRRIEATASVVRDLRGEATGLRWLLVDRTRRFRAERSVRARGAELEALVAERTAELRDAQHIKDQLIATVSHEFRTALAAIGGYAELLETGVRGPMSDVQLSDIRRIIRAYRHLARIVEDLLSYSRLVSGALAIEATDMSVRDAVGTLFDLVVPAAAAKHVHLEIEAVDGSLVAYADPERVKQILLNLLGNALKFTPANGRVSLRCAGCEQVVQIAVADSGVGIPENRIESIFEPFVRLRNSGTEPGTGLGLSISRDLARAMGGDITATSTLEQGSRFVLTLPRSRRFAAGDEQR